MDKTTTQLDPKLKEAYDRVMGTVITPSPKSPNQSQQSTSLPEHSEPVQSAPPPLPIQPTLEHPAAATPVMATVTAQAPIVQKGVAVKKKKRVSPLIIGLLVIVFLAVYAVVWVKYFGLKVPFLNP